jgi:hypothetical protein
MDDHTKQRVRDYLEAGNVLTSYDGFEKLGTTCAKDYVGFLIRKDHLPIKSEWRKSPSDKRYKAYWIARELQKEMEF